MMGHARYSFPGPSESGLACCDAVIANRCIRIFVSSTFRDMIEDRHELMTHAWPELRRFCRERQVELVEVDLRWGVTEKQHTRRETIKYCLDAIHACRPFFIGLLGERYGKIFDDDAFTADLREEQSWLEDIHGKSLTELEIFHGVLNNPEMAKRAFFYFRDPNYVESMPAEKKANFAADDSESAEKQKKLKALIHQVCNAKDILLRENYPDPVQLATLVVDDLKIAIEAQFPIGDVPDALALEARDHEAFAEIRRRTYIGRPDYFDTLDGHTGDVGGPLVLLGDSGSGKSALLANWLAHWHKEHSNDYIFQHYIGGTPDSAGHWRLMTRLVSEIKRWSGDPEELPKSHDDLFKKFPVWLDKARYKAERDGARCIVVLDALDQLEDRDHARLLGWLPSHPFTGALRLIVSTLPGETLDAVKQRGWVSQCVKSLEPDERRKMIEHYLARFGKKLDAARLERIAKEDATANPLYLKILLDELRVTGTHERLDERLTDYLAAPDIQALLKKVLCRYQHDYERDRPRLVCEALGLIWAARRGLTETELLRLLKPAGLPQLPQAIWAPLRNAMEENLVDRGGILNFAHEFLRMAVADVFVPDATEAKKLRLRLANDFEAQPVTTRTCDELPWLLKETDSHTRLRSCLLNIGCFLLIRERDEAELRGYWVEQLQEQQTMGKAYLWNFERWSRETSCPEQHIARVANELAAFLSASALHAQAEPLMRRALAIDDSCFGKDHLDVAVTLNNLAQLLQATNRLAEAEPLMRRALAIFERSFGKDHPKVAIATDNLAQLLKATNRHVEAEPLMRRALAIAEESFGKDHPDVAIRLNNLGAFLKDTNRFADAELLLHRSLDITEHTLGKDHPRVAMCLSNLASLLMATNRHVEAEPLMRRALAIDESCFGHNHPDVAGDLNTLGRLLYETNRLAEAEPLMRRALAIDEQSYGKDHPAVANKLNNLAQLFEDTGRLPEAEPLMRRALTIDEQSFGKDHPDVARDLNNLARLFYAENRLTEAEPLMRRALDINEQSYGKDHPVVAVNLNNLVRLL